MNYYNRASSCFILWKKGSTAGERSAAEGRFQIMYSKLTESEKRNFDREFKYGSYVHNNYQKNSSNDFNNSFHKAYEAYKQSKKTQDDNQWYEKRYEKMATEAQVAYVKLICNVFDLRRPIHLTYAKAVKFLREWAPVYERFTNFKAKYVYPEGWDGI